MGPFAGPFFFAQSLECARGAAWPTGPGRLVEKGSKARNLSQNKKSPIQGLFVIWRCSWSCADNVPPRSRHYSIEAAIQLRTVFSIYGIGADATSSTC